jgi:hypothetical protein
MWWQVCGVLVMSVVVLIILVYKYHRRLIPWLNPDLIQPFTPQAHFDFVQTERFKSNVEQGTKVAKNSSLVICGLIRNRQNRIDEVEKRVNLLAQKFGRVVVLVVENDSDDLTRRRLITWAKRSYKRHSGYQVELLGCQIDPNPEKTQVPVNCFLNMPETNGHGVTSGRLEKMATLRNIYLDRVVAKYTNFDYCLVWDMDTFGSLYVDGVLSTIANFQTHPEIDGICANGLYLWPGMDIYYDTLAHSEEGLDEIVKVVWFDPIGHVLTSLWTKTWSGSEPIRPVQRCFSGATIYRTQAFVKNRYTTEGLECEHNSLAKGLNMAVNQHMVNHILYNQ